MNAVVWNNTTFEMLKNGSIEGSIERGINSANEIWIECKRGRRFHRKSWLHPNETLFFAGLDGESNFFLAAHFSQAWIHKRYHLTFVKLSYVARWVSLAQKSFNRLDEISWNDKLIAALGWQSHQLSSEGRSQTSSQMHKVHEAARLSICRQLSLDDNRICIIVINDPRGNRSPFWFTPVD